MVHQSMLPRTLLRRKLRAAPQPHSFFLRGREKPYLLLSTSQISTAEIKGIKCILQLWGKRVRNSCFPTAPIVLIYSLCSQGKSATVVSPPQPGSERPRLFTEGPQSLFAGSLISGSLQDPAAVPTSSQPFEARARTRSHSRSHSRVLAPRTPLCAPLLRRVGGG